MFSIWDLIIFCIVAPIAAFFVYALLVWMPVSIYAESRCLAKGYPKTHVDVFLNTYCSNLDGSVTVKVDKLGK